MVNWVYQPTTLGHHLAIYLEPLLPVTHHQRFQHLVAIYHEQKLIGFNLEQPLQLFPNLKPGIMRKISQADLKRLEAYMQMVGCPYSFATFHSGFIIGGIQSLEPHPEADHLMVCQINIGTKIIQVVTNSKKVKVHNHVVVALPGAMLIDGQIIEEGMMLRVKSEGMLTSEKTLGIHPESQVGVLILPETTPIGKDYYAQ